jgi:uncharacterized OB-fold protein
MRPYWEAALRHKLLIQRCMTCGRHQFYPRPFCLACSDERIEWVESAGQGTIYSATTVFMAVLPELEPPYVVAVVELDEGPRITTNIVGPDGIPENCQIGSRVWLAWRDRGTGSLPPLPVFTPGQRAL